MGIVELDAMVGRKEIKSTVQPEATNGENQYQSIVYAHCHARMSRHITQHNTTPTLQPDEQMKQAM